MSQRSIAGDCWGPGAPSDGNRGSRSWALSVSMLLAYCHECGFMRPRSRRKGRSALWQKCRIMKDLFPPTELQQGALAAPLCLITMTFSLKDCPSVQPLRQAPEPHADFLWKSPSSQGDLSDSRAHGWLQPQTSRHKAGSAWSVEVTLTQWLFMSKNPQ